MYVQLICKDRTNKEKDELYEVLGALIQGMGEMERLANVLTTDPEDVKKAQEALQKAEAIMRGEKVE